MSVDSYSTFFPVVSRFCFFFFFFFVVASSDYCRIATFPPPSTYGYIRDQKMKTVSNEYREIITIDRRGEKYVIIELLLISWIVSWICPLKKINITCSIPMEIDEGS